MSNVIEFPTKDKVNASARTREELQQVLNDYKQEIAEEASEYLWRNLLGEMSRMGCDFDKEIKEHFPSMVLVLESIRSLHLQAHGVHHPLQEFAAEFVDIEEIENFEQEAKKMVDIDEDIE
jgi:hypothetical protein